MSAALRYESRLITSIYRNIFSALQSVLESCFLCPKIFSKNLFSTFDELVSWAELYEKAEFVQKKMIVNCLIRRVDVYRDYKLKIDFNFDFQQFISGIDTAA